MVGRFPIAVLSWSSDRLFLFDEICITGIKSADNQFIGSGIYFFI